MKAPDREVGKAIRTVKRAARDGDDAAVAETRRLLRETGPAAAELLRYAICADRFTSSFQRVRAAIAVLSYGGFGPEARVFHEPEESGHDDAGEAA